MEPFEEPLDYLTTIANCLYPDLVILPYHHLGHIRATPLPWIHNLHSLPSDLPLLSPDWTPSFVNSETLPQE